MLHSRNPLSPPAEHRAVAPMTPLRSLAPATAAPLMLRVNGAWLLRADWDRWAMPGDVIEWHEIPQGGQTSRTVLSVILLIVVAVFQPELLAAYGSYAAAASAAIIIVGNALINALVPIQAPNNGAGGAGVAPGSVYSVATAANQARLGQPIPVIYGRHRVFPDYAAQPYVEYLRKPDGTDTNDQYFHGIYCIGHGAYCAEWAVA